MNDKYDIIRCTELQWSDVMSKLAQHHFALHPNCPFVLVQEHAGWHFGYRRDMTCWSTANDNAVLTHPQPQPTAYSGVSIKYPEIS